MRAAVSPLPRILAAANEQRELVRVARAGIAYIDEIDAPNLREPFSIINRRCDLRDAVFALPARRARKAVPVSGFLRSPPTEALVSLFRDAAPQLKCSRCGERVRTSSDHLAIGEFGERWTCNARAKDAKQP